MNDQTASSLTEKQLALIAKSDPELYEKVLKAQDNLRFLDEITGERPELLGTSTRLNELSTAIEEKSSKKIDQLKSDLDEGLPKVKNKFCEVMGIQNLDEVVINENISAKCKSAQEVVISKLKVDPEKYKLEQDELRKRASSTNVSMEGKNLRGALEEYSKSILASAAAAAAKHQETLDIIRRSNPKDAESEVGKGPKSLAYDFISRLPISLQSLISGLKKISQVKEGESVTPSTTGRSRTENEEVER